MTIRLNKHLADMGVASRRGAEKLILGGQVKVNGAVVTDLATRVDPAADRVDVEGAPAAGAPGYLLHKPAGVVTTKGDGEGKTILDLLPPDAAGMSHAGRLDKDSRGLVLMLADGRISYAATAPETHLEKEYQVTVETEAKDGQLQKMRDGLVIDGSRTKPARVQRLGQDRFSIVLTEGRNRQIRKMCAKVGLKVTDLLRVRIGPLQMGSLAEGRHRPLDSEDIQKLKQALPDHD